MTEVTSTSASSDVAKPDDSARKPGKLGNMVSMFEKKAEEKQQPPLATRSASNSLSTITTPISPLQHSASTSSATSPVARVGASIADRMAAMKGLTMIAPAPLTASSHAVPGKLSAAAKTLPLSFEPPANSPLSPSASSSSSHSAGNTGPRPNKLAMGGLGALNAALANGLKAGIAPGGVRSPAVSVTKRDDSDVKRAAETRHDDQKEEALLHTAPAAITSSSDDSTAGGGGAVAELTHAKRAKRAGRTKAASRLAAGTLKFKDFSDVSKAADMKAAVTIVGGEEKKEQKEAVETDKEAKTEEAAEIKEQSLEKQVSEEPAPASEPVTAASSTEAAVVTESSAASAVVGESEALAPTDIPAGNEPTVSTESANAPVSESKAEASLAPVVVLPSTAVESPLDSSSASINSEDSLNSSFSASVTNYAPAAELDSSFSGEQLSVYNAAADYFHDPATLGYNPALHAGYSTLLHTGATLHRWQNSGSSAKRLLYLSDCSTCLCLVDSKKRLPLDKVENKRRLPVALLSEVVKGKVAGDEVWARAACKDVLASRCMVVRCGGGSEVGEGMLSVMHVEALTGVQRDEWEEALRWLIATKGKGRGSTDK